MSAKAVKPMDEAAGGTVVWSVSAKPVSVHLNLEVVRGIEALLAAAPREFGRAVEAGGILLGRARQAAPDYWLVAVESFEAVEIEYVRGASWTLSNEDKKRLAASLRRHAKPGRDALAPVGWFRTHSRPGLFLDQHDFELFQQFFPDPSQVALVIRPEEEAPPVAGFFLWENGEIHRRSSYSTFPFRASALAPLAMRALPAPAASVVSVAAAHGAAAAPKPPRAAPSKRPLRNAPGYSLAWRKAVLWAPVAAGLAAAILWNPAPLANPQRNRVRTPAPPPEQSTRAVFPENEPAPPPVVVEPPPAAPKKAAAQRPSRVVRRELGALPPRREAPNPRLVTEAPPLAVANPVTVPGAASLRLELAPYLASATVEPARVSGIRRAVGSIPGLGFLKKKNKKPDFVAARPIHQVRPASPGHLAEEVPVRVKLLVSESGDVVSAELMGRRVNPELGSLAVDAAKRWKFAPAKEADAPVETEVVVQFRFGPGAGDL